MRFRFMVAFLAFATTVSSQPIKVMTYNIRYDNTGDGVNQWENRKEKVANLIRKNDPDLIGLQEALINQIKDLLLLLPDYSSYGVGRDDGKEKGEFSCILVRHARFGVLRDSTMWLSETPGIPGSKGWDAQLPRVATWTELYDKETKKEILYVNTHFDHIGKQARTNSAVMISNFVTDYSKNKEVAIIVTGDLNVQRNTEAFKVLIEPNLLMDSKPDWNNDPTFCGFDVTNTKCTQIDYIFHSKETVVVGYTVLRDNDGKFYPSDHLAVLAELEFLDDK
ncbi:endonuclease/exonuclease/phosphatase family protein [soil metagenome]